MFSVLSSEVDQRAVCAVCVVLSRAPGTHVFNHHHPQRNRKRPLRLLQRTYGVCVTSYGIEGSSAEKLATNCAGHDFVWVRNRHQLLGITCTQRPFFREIPTQSWADMTKVKLPTLVAVHTKDGIVTEIIQGRDANKLDQTVLLGTVVVICVYVCLQLSCSVHSPYHQAYDTIRDAILTCARKPT